MIQAVFLALTVALLAASAHARRWQNLEVGHREFQTSSGTSGVALVYSVTADLVAGGVVFDLAIERRASRFSHSTAEFRITKAELEAFEAVLKTCDQWREHARNAATPAFDLRIGHAGDIEWRFHWSGNEAQLHSGAGLRRRPVVFSEADVAVFRVLLLSAPEMEREIRTLHRRRKKGRRRRRSWRATPAQA
jgi:hypothetical protein